MPSWVLKKIFTQNLFSPKIFLGEARRNTMLPNISSLCSCNWIALVCCGPEALCLRSFSHKQVVVLETIYKKAGSKETSFGNYEKVTWAFFSCFRKSQLPWANANYPLDRPQEGQSGHHLPQPEAAMCPDYRQRAVPSKSLQLLLSKWNSGGTRVKLPSSIPSEWDQFKHQNSPRWY